MPEEKDKKEIKEVKDAKEMPVEAKAMKETDKLSGTKETKPQATASNRGMDDKRTFKKNKRSPRRKPKQRSEFDQKLIGIRRVTRVSSGGRRFSFSVSVVIGNKKGKVGVGTGKAGDTSLAIDKAVKDAQKNAIQVKTTGKMSIPHQVSAKFNSARITLIPAPGRGVIAGSALRDIVELGGLNDINGKIFSGSKNKLNIAKAVIIALESFEKTVVKEDKLTFEKPAEKPAKKLFQK